MKKYANGVFNLIEINNMFKKSLLALSLIAISGVALSAPVANLKINGTITPPTCTINNENETEIQYNFDVAPGLFPASGNLTLDSQVKDIEVVCDATTFLSFDISDNRADSVMTAGSNNFGLGEYGETTKVGFYNVTMQNAKVQATPESTANVAGIKTGTTGAAAAKVLDKTMSTTWTVSTASNTAASGQVFSAELAVKPTLNAALKNSDGTAKLDGHAVLAFGFGI